MFFYLDETRLPGRDYCDLRAQSPEALRPERRNLRLSGGSAAVCYLFVLYTLLELIL